MVKYQINNLWTNLEKMVHALKSSIIHYQIFLLSFSGVSWFSSTFYFVFQEIYFENVVILIGVTAYFFAVHCSTLQMLTNIENRLEELFEMIETMPQDKVEAAEKVCVHIFHIFFKR